MRIHALRTGSVRVKHSFLFPAEGPRRQLDLFLPGPFSEPLPIHCWAVEHEGRLLLVDTGETAAARDIPFARFEVEARGELPAAMSAAGLDPADVDEVVLTHHHGDHVDGIVHVRAPVRISVAELAHLGAPFSRMMRRVLRQPLPPGFSPHAFELTGGPFGAFDPQPPLSEDGRIVAVPTPGHTPGHVSVVCVDDERPARDARRRRHRHARAAPRAARGRSRSGPEGPPRDAGEDPRALPWAPHGVPAEPRSRLGGAPARARVTVHASLSAPPAQASVNQTTLPAGSGRTPHRPDIASTIHRPRPRGSSTPGESTRGSPPLAVAHLDADLLAVDDTHFEVGLRVAHAVARELGGQQLGRVDELGVAAVERRADEPRAALTAVGRHAKLLVVEPHRSTTRTSLSPVSSTTRRTARVGLRRRTLGTCLAALQQHGDPRTVHEAQLRHVERQALRRGGGGLLDRAAQRLDVRDVEFSGEREHRLPVGVGAGLDLAAALPRSLLALPLDAHESRVVTMIVGPEIAGEPCKQILVELLSHRHRPEPLEALVEHLAAALDEPVGECQERRAAAARRPSTSRNEAVCGKPIGGSAEISTNSPSSPSQQQRRQVPGAGERQAVAVDVDEGAEDRREVLRA